MSNAIEWQQVLVAKSSLQGCDVFPLDLTIIEKFFVWDDHPHYPKRFQILVDCDGTLDHSVWIEALKQSVVRHPMLVASIAEVDRYWTLDQARFDVAFVPLSTIDPTKLIPPESIVERLSVTASPNSQSTQHASLRVAVFEQPEGLTLAFDVYHPNCDGLGMRMFIEDATSCYNALMRSDESLKRWKKVEPQRLIYRHECPTPKSKDNTRQTTLWEKAKHAYHFHLRGPYPVVPKSKASSLDVQPKLAFRSFELDFDKLRDLKDFFVTESINVNEWSIACLLQTLSLWQAQNQLPRRRMRVMLPVDLRVWDDLRLAACNKIGFAFLVEEKIDSESPRALLHSVKSQLEGIRSLCLGADFVRLFEPFKKLGWFVRRVMRRTKCFSTAVITNLGDVTARQRKGRDEETGRSSAGDLRLRAIYGWPPLRPGTQVGIGICRYDQRLSIAGVFDRSAFDEKQVDELFALYIDCFSQPSSKSVES